MAVLVACLLSGQGWSASAGDWSAPNSGIAGANGDVTVVAVAPNGDLYVGGRFTAIGDVVANHVARWDGSHWSALGTGVLGTGVEVYAIAFDSVGNVYVGGYFKYCGGLNTGAVARWDGKSWSAMGAGLHGSVYSLVPGDSGGVVAGGLFRFDPNSSSALQVASWNGKDWSQVGAVGPGGTVQAMLRRQDGALLACGDHVVRWNGSVWQQMGTSMPACYAMAEDRQGTLYIGGSFDDGVIGATKIWGVARWDGMDWKPILDGPIEMAKSLATDSVGNVYAAGYFDSAGGRPAQGLVKWDGKDWSDVAGSLSKGMGYALAIDSTGSLVVGGSFRVAGDLGARALARWDGSRWSTYGKGINGPVHAVAWDREGRLYVGGEFTATASGRASSVAMWDGQTWNSLGGGVDLPGAIVQGKVKAMIVDSSGNLYIGGQFESVAGVRAASLAKWDGRSWSALGSPDYSFKLPEVNALAIGPDGRLYASGVANMNVGVWGGSNWTSLNLTAASQILTLSFDAEGRLLAGGRGGSDFSNTVMRFDDTGWTSLVSSSDGPVRALARLADGRMIAAGGFSQLGLFRIFGVAVWEEWGWDSLRGIQLETLFGVPADIGATSLAADRRGGLVVGRFSGTNSDNLREVREGIRIDDGIDPDNSVFALAIDSSGRLAMGGGFGSLRAQRGEQEILYAPYLAVRVPSTVSVAPPARRANSLDGRKVRLEILAIDGRRKASREIASWSSTAEVSALRDLGRGTWMVRRIATGAKSEASLVVVP